MYLGTLGGSALLHVLVSHPKVVAVFGLVTTVLMLGTPHGPFSYAGADQYASTIERQIQARQPVDDAVIQQAASEAESLLSRPADELEPIARRRLRECGVHCTELSLTTIMGRPEVLKQLLYLDALDRLHHEAAASQR